MTEVGEEEFAHAGETRGGVRAGCDKEGGGGEKRRAGRGWEARKDRGGSKEGADWILLL